MTEQFRETVRPYVVASLDVREGVIFVLVIRNTGRSPASNLKITLDRDFFQFAEHRQERNLRAFKAFNVPIATFAPEQSLSFDLSQGFNMDTYEDGILLTPSTIMVSLEYSFVEMNYRDNVWIDTNPYMGTHVPKTVSEHLRIISEDLKKLVR